MMHRAWISVGEVPCCFSWSSIKFQSHTGQNIANFDPNWAFPECNSSLNSLMDLKWCTKLDIVWKKCPIIFRGHQSNFKVTRAEKLTIWIQFEITGPVAAINSLRFAFFHWVYFFLFLSSLDQISANSKSSIYRSFFFIFDSANQITNCMSVCMSWNHQLTGNRLSWNDANQFTQFYV